MSTHANIILEPQQAGQKYESIYLHFGESPVWLLGLLNAHYSERAQVEKMISLGNCSYLTKSLDYPDGHSFANPIDGFSVFYGRDRGEEGQQAMTSTVLTTHMKKVGCDFTVMYTRGDKWILVNRLTI